MYESHGAGRGPQQMCKQRCARVAAAGNGARARAQTAPATAADHTAHMLTGVSQRPFSLRWVRNDTATRAQRCGPGHGRFRRSCAAFRISALSARVHRYAVSCADKSAACSAHSVHLLGSRCVVCSLLAWVCANGNVSALRARPQAAQCALKPPQKASNFAVVCTANNDEIRVAILFDATRKHPTRAALHRIATHAATLWRAGSRDADCREARTAAGPLR